VSTGGFGLLSNDKSGPSSTTTSVTANGGSSRNEGACVGGGSVVQAPVNCPPPTPVKPPPPIATTAEAGCGSIGGPLAKRRVQLKVLMWCAPKSVRGQYEYKLKVTVRNTGKVRLDIRRQRFFLLWRTLKPGQWSPPQGGAPARPRRLQYQKRDYWAISANLEGAAEARGNALTFATHWNHTTLAPGQSSLHLRKDHQALQYVKNGNLGYIRFNYHEDDLVFYVPASAVDRDHNFLGLAYHDGNRIIAVCPQPNWGPMVPPSVF
jgi:hypothetical protein